MLNPPIGRSSAVFLGSLITLSLTATVAASDQLPPGADPSVDASTLSEFEGNYGLGAIGADAALALGLTGAGITVGIIDSGIDIRPGGTSHPAFQGRIDPRSHSNLYWFDPAGLSESPTTDQVAAAFEQGDESQALNPHGTHVAGIIGAARDGVAMHGVAPMATLLDIKAIGQRGETPWGNSINFGEICGQDTALTSSVTACDPVVPDTLPENAALQYLARQGDVGVINGSFGPSAEHPRTWSLPVTNDFTDLRRQAAAVGEVMDAGHILVMAAGNAFIDTPVLAESPLGIGLFPFIRPENAGAVNSSGSRIYDDGGAGIDFSFLSYENLAAAEARDGHERGRIVAVVALDGRNQIASYSNRCGVAKYWCIAAPGGDQPGLAQGHPDIGDRGILSAYPDLQTAYESGTSMAAPHVTGAVAILLEAYPGFSAAEIVGLMFHTAQDLGRPGVDPVYGWGLLRLDRALSGPVGMDTRDTGIAGFSTTDGDRVWGFGFVSQGGFDKSGAGLLDIRSPISFAQDSRVTDGPLAINGVLTVPVLTVMPAGVLGGSGMLVGNVHVDGQLAPGNSPGTLTIVGDVALGQSAVLEIEIDGPETADGAGSFDRLIVLGAGSTFTANGALTPILRGITGDATNSFTPSLGQVFDVVNVPNGRIAGGFTSLNQPSDGLPAGTRMDALYSERAIGLAATPQRYAALDTLGLPLTANSRALGRAVDTIRPAPGTRPEGRLNDTFNALYRADRTALADDFETLTGQIHADTGRAALRSIDRFSTVLSSRKTGSALSGTRLAEDDYGSGRLWLAGYGSFGQSGDSSGIAGVRDRAAGAAVGIEREFGDLTIGVAAGHEARSLDAGRHGDGSINGYHGGLYLSVPGGIVDLAVRGGVSYGAISTDRSTVLGGYGARAEADSHGFGQFADAAVSHTVETEFAEITPSLSVGYRRFSRSSFTETGSAFALAGGNQSVDQLTTELGATVSRQFNLDSGMTITPTVSLGWRHDLRTPTREADLSLAGSAFTVGGVNHGRDAIVGGFDFQAETGDAFSLGASVGGEWRDNFAAYGASARMVMRF